MPPPELGAIASALALPLDGAAQARLLRYLELLQRWNATYNLTAVRDPSQMLTQHLADCLAIVPALTRYFGDGATKLLDVGSGAGLPGVVIAALMPAVDVTCVDAVGKKAAFVRQVAAELDLRNLHVEHGRVERGGGGQFDAITSRAFASLRDFTSLTRARLAAGGVWIAMKGQVPEQEVSELAPDIDVFHVEQLDVPGLDALRCLVWMRPHVSV
jgi:16S rRNA (guanine527-N7)-methyltransferase